MKRGFVRIIAAAALLFGVLAVPTGASADTGDQACTAVYQPDDGGSIDGKPTTETLVSYSCISADSAAAKAKRMHPNIGAQETMLKGWDKPDYKGSSVDFDQSGLWGVDPCDSDGYRWDSMPGGWNDRIDSIRGYMKCNYVRAYKDNNTSGHCQKYVTDITNVGTTMHNQISSLRAASVAHNC